MTPSQKKAYVIADNQLAMNSGWDTTLLSIELAELKDEDFDLSLLGFDDKELDKLLQPEVSDGLTDEDAVPDAPEEPPARPVPRRLPALRQTGLRPHHETGPRSLPQPPCGEVCGTRGQVGTWEQRLKTSVPTSFPPCSHLRRGGNNYCFCSVSALCVGRRHCARMGSMV